MSEGALQLLLEMDLCHPSIYREKNMKVTMNKFYFRLLSPSGTSISEVSRATASKVALHSLQWNFTHWQVKPIAGTEEQAGFHSLFRLRFAVCCHVISAPTSLGFFGPWCVSAVFAHDTLVQQGGKFQTLGLHKLRPQPQLHPYLESMNTRKRFRRILEYPLWLMLQQRMNS